MGLENSPISEQNLLIFKSQLKPSLQVFAKITGISIFMMISSGNRSKVGGVPDGPMYTFPLNPSFQVFRKNLHLQEDQVPP